MEEGGNNGVTERGTTVTGECPEEEFRTSEGDLRGLYALFFTK